MGAPKQRWTAEEEAALKAGIALGMGLANGAQFLKDPDFGTILLARSNVDLKERYSAPPDLERLLAADLKLLTNNGKVKHQYRIAPVSSPFGLKKEPPPLLLEQKQNSSPRAEINNTKALTKSQIDAELEKIRSMTEQEAAAAAIAEAEEAAREAEAAEADAESY